jgi:cell wall-associated NlpC family hydrolase
VQALLNQTSKILGTPAPQLPAFSAPRPLPMAPQPHPAAGGPTATPAVPGSTVGAKIAKTALTQLGTPYQWGGPAKLGSRTDCSGLLQASAAANGIRIGRTTYEQWKQGTPVPLNQLQPGDAVFSHADSRGPGHVSIYIGNGQIVEDPHTGEVVSISDLAGRAGVIGARRYG